ncbi:MAG: DUF503 domain-containing protein [Desulfobacterales bacterium]|nr:DUF503 domain-containing protein [Desulfobacterales bacterium]
MVVGLGVLTFRLPDCRSLKGKRSIVTSIIGKIRNRFVISIAEVGSNDMHQRAEIGFALVGNDRKVINANVDKVFNMADQISLAELINTDIEIINI